MKSIGYLSSLISLLAAVAFYLLCYTGKGYLWGLLSFLLFLASSTFAYATHSGRDASLQYKQMGIKLNQLETDNSQLKLVVEALAKAALYGVIAPQTWAENIEPNKKVVLSYLDSISKYLPPDFEKTVHTDIENAYK